MTTIDAKGKRKATETPSTPGESSSSSGSGSPLKKLRLNDGSLPLRGWLETMVRMGGTPPVFLISKVVTASDTNEVQNRLLLPRGAMDNSDLGSILTSAEEAAMQDKERGLAVRVLDGAGRVYRMKLKFLQSNNGYRLIGQDWSRFVANNRLRAGLAVVDLWAFRALRRGAAARFDRNEEEPLEMWLAITVLSVLQVQSWPLTTSATNPSLLRGGLVVRNWKVRL